ncbi:MAG TPA: ABC transporter permease [Gemmatimonadaceae bacterium]|nr:ABC transporter permease [Gemmatimonadaceae bacterium]
MRRYFRLSEQSPQRVDADIDEELRFHFTMREEELIAAGATPEAAHAQALREFGDVEFTRQYCRDMDTRQARERRRGELWDGLRQDLVAATRQLRHNPGYALAATLTLALGIGATTAIFGAVNGVLLRPLVYEDADRIMTVWQTDRKHGVERDEVSPANFLDWRDRARSFERLVTMEPWGLDYQGTEGPETLDTWLVSDGFFEALGTRPLLGRIFLPDEYTAGKDRVVMLTYNAWQRRFGGDRGIVGTTLRLDGEPHLVAGVMPPEFDIPRGTEAWTPKVFTEAETRMRRSTFYVVIGRLRPGVTVSMASAEMASIASQLAKEHPDVNADVGASVVPLPEALVGEVRPALLILLGAVGLVLLISCANVANLMLARAVRREREFAIRAALGAGRRRLVRQLLVESLVLAAIAGGLGVLFARWGVDAIRGLAPTDLPRLNELSIDGRVLAFAIAISVLTALLFGLAPALRAAASNIHEELKAGGRAASAGRVKHRMRAALVVGEIAMAMVLLVGAGLLGRSFIALLSVDRGYQTDKVLAITVQSWGYFPTPPARREFARQAVERIATLPSVRAVGVTSSLPLSPAIGAHSASIVVVGRDAPDSAQLPSIHATVATSGYFDAMGMKLRRGRMFESTDDDRGRPVMLINETLAKQYWPGANPIGEQVRVTFAGPPVVREVIGIVNDVRHAGLQEVPRPGIYIPHAQQPTGALVFTVRTAGEPLAMARRVQEAIWSFNAQMPVARTATLEGLLDDSLRERRFHLMLLGAFSLSALLLAVVGVYGVLSQATIERTQELGVRIALGAQSRDILSLTLGNGLRLALLGVVLGLLGAAALTRLLQGMLFGVSSTDPMTFAALAIIVVAVSVVASYIPARRATRVDPLTALRAT